MLIRLEQKLDTVAVALRDNRQLAMLPHGDIVLLLKTKHVRIKMERLILVVYHYTREHYFHQSFFFRLGNSQRATIASSGVVSR